MDDNTYKQDNLQNIQTSQKPMMIAKTRETES